MPTERQTERPPTKAEADAALHCQIEELRQELAFGTAAVLKAVLAVHEDVKALIRSTEGRREPDI